MDAQEAAKALYFEGWEQQRIAKALKYSEQTISAWKKKGEWDRKRAEQNMARETAEERVWRIINFQLGILDRISDIKRKSIEKVGDGEDALQTLNAALIGKGDIDALQKLFTTVKSKQHTWTNYVSILREFMDYLQGVDLETAKELVDRVDEFLNQKRKEL